jgi:bacterioferritin (cytochrome b1)
MLRFDLNNENETIRNYRARVRQCEQLGEFALAGQIRQILVEEQGHQIDLATALGDDKLAAPQLHQRRQARGRRPLADPIEAGPEVETRSHWSVPI